MRISEITITEIKQYANIDHNLDDNLLEMILKSSLSYILNYTGLTLEETNNKEELAFVLLTLANELYDNRVYSVKDDKVNVVIKSMLDMHSRNLL